MFFRYRSGARAVAVDLDGLYQDQAIFIVAGSPAIKTMPLHYLSRRGIVSMGINNASDFMQTNLWVSNDRPECFSERILVDPVIMKFINMGKRGRKVRGRDWCYQPNTYVFGCSDHFTERNFLSSHRDLLWWKNTFFTALQLSWRLGFRRVYLVGAVFKIDDKNQYAWNTKLKPEFVAKNRTLYRKTVEAMERMRPMFESKGFHIYNCCEESALTPAYGHVGFGSAVEREAAAVPLAVDTTKLVYASYRPYTSGKVTG